MKRIYLFLLGVLFVMVGCERPAQEDVWVELQSRQWEFVQVEQSAMKFNTSAAEQEVEVDAKQGFTVRFNAELDNSSEQYSLFEIADVLSVEVKRVSPDYNHAQNYKPYPLADGSLWVLEAALALQSPFSESEVNHLRVGVPLSLLAEPFSGHEIVLHFTGVEFSLFVDGKLYDNDFAIGYPSFSGSKQWQKGGVVGEVEFFAPALDKKQVGEPTQQRNIQYWTPPYHNAWVGDVATIYHKGRYHIFYLFDRRGHASKLGRGGHYFEHISTSDFKHWTEHPAATPIEEQWESFGTGTPFVYNDKLYLSYGLHTTRIYPREMTTLPAMWQYLQENGVSQVFDYRTAGDYVPAGSTYSVSEDCVTNFKKTHKLFHPCENPSVYTTKNGELRMLANYGSRGSWSAESLDSGWCCDNPDFPLGGDCTFFFEWGDYEYIIGGFRDLWCCRVGEGDDRWWSMTSEGRDFYNGLSVPAITEISDSRRLMAGWVKTQNWGGPLVIHELVQRPDGQIGVKWMEEIVPATSEPFMTCGEVAKNATFDIANKRYILSFDVELESPDQGRVGVVFHPEEGFENACEWQLQLDRKRAQFANGVAEGFAKDERTLREGGDVSGVRNYAISDPWLTKKTISVRMVVDGSDKFCGTLLDVEINGERTMISYRPNLQVGKLSFNCEKATVKNLRVAEFRE